MYRNASVFLLLLSFFAFVKQVEAEVSVSVNNNVNSSSTTQQSSTNKTTIRIETNGEVHEFKAEGDESINWQSDDGQSSVKVNQNTTSVHSSSNETNEEAESTPIPTEEQENEPTESAENESKKETPEPKSIIEVVISFIASLFS